MPRDPAEPSLPGPDSVPEDRTIVRVQAGTAPPPFGTVLEMLAVALSRGPDGRDRGEDERHLLIEEARAVLDRAAAAPIPAHEAHPAGGAGLRPGQVLANTYVVRTLLARGGMGEVYRVRHRDIGSDHAVKVLLPAYAAAPEIASLLLTEARLHQAVHHDAVLACQGLLHDADGRLLLVTEYLRGITLAARLRRGALSRSELTVLVRRIAGGLSAVHEAGIAHLDISPDNIILADDSLHGAKIIDFGLARRIAEPAGTALDFAGKYSWVSPEQLDGAGKPLDIRSDIYSFGLVIAAAARGAKIELGADPATARAARRALPTLDGVPEDLHPLLRRMLAPVPAQRPATADAVLQDWPAATARTDGPRWWLDWMLGRG